MEVCLRRYRFCYRFTWLHGYGVTGSWREYGYCVELQFVDCGIRRTNVTVISAMNTHWSTTHSILKPIALMNVFRNLLLKNVAAVLSICQVFSINI